MTKVPHILVATKLGISQLVTIKPNRPQHTVSLFALESEISATKTHNYISRQIARCNSIPNIHILDFNKNGTITRRKLFNKINSQLSTLKSKSHSKFVKLDFFFRNSLKCRPVVTLDFIRKWNA